MQNIGDILKNHQSFSQLIAKLETAVKQQQGKLLLPLIEISGIPFALQQELIKAVAEELQSGILYSERDSMEVRNYLETIQHVALAKTRRPELLRLLQNHNFVRVSKVLNPGELFFAGDVVNFWPIGFYHPVRVSYFGDSMESARMYDEVYGKSLHEVNNFYLGDLKEFAGNAGKEYVKVFADANPLLPAVIIFGGEANDTFESREDVHFDFTYPTLFFHRFDLLENEIAHKIANGFQVAIITEHKQAIPEKLKKYIAASDVKMEAGFQSNQAKIFCLTDRELFGTVFLTKETRHLTSDRARKLLAELEGEIDIGDYIVHEDYGIGIYKGIKQERYEQKIPLGFGQFKTKSFYEDYLLVEYAEKDQLFIPLNHIDKITKYIGLENQTPHITRLGKNEWQNFTRRVKKQVAEIAKELIELYAQRALANAHEIPSESDSAYEEFTQAFPYQETPDQTRTEKEVLQDLRSTRPMNRLIVGDVGFGKTEVAMRAAFKTVEAGMQVAVLCPTTVLTAQHEKVFTDRFQAFPFRVAAVSRFSQAQNKKLLADLSEGKIDIIIGTHRLLGNDIKFKNLGLLIIDEEQKFGVTQKEKLKKLAYGVHVLTMSATPIPRSLSMALSEIQDISIIQTPPEGRKAIKTTVERIDWQKIVQAITFEVARNGQVYFVHNRVSTISSTLQKLQRLMPHIRFVMAHGQMPAEKLQDTMNKFYNKEFDCLVCTTIIENGLDMPNVNTIVIEHAQNFGLGQLYQLRGRVGRGAHQAFAYLFYEGENLEKADEHKKPQKTHLIAAEYEVDPDEPQEEEEKQSEVKRNRNYLKRLKAILEAQDVGAGFRLASRDLEIRGAGNLLGKQQHGNINYVGYGLYMQLLAEEIEKLRSLLQ